MPNDAILDELKQEKTRLRASLTRMQDDATESSTWGSQWAVTRVAMEKLRWELNLVNLKIIQRLAFLNGRDFMFGGSFRRRLTTKDDNNDSA